MRYVARRPPREGGFQLILVSSNGGWEYYQQLGGRIVATYADTEVEILPGSTIHDFDERVYRFLSEYEVEYPPGYDPTPRPTVEQTPEDSPATRG